MTSRSSPAKSITRRLLIALVLPVALLVAAGAGLTAFMAQRSVDRLHDQQMQNTAGVLMSFVLYEALEHANEDAYGERDEDVGEDAADDLADITDTLRNERGLPVDFRLTENGRVLFTSGAIRQLPRCTPGFSRINGGQWQCFRDEQQLDDIDTDLAVEVFESTRTRQAAIRSLMMATFGPLVALPVLVLGLSYFGLAWVRRSLLSVSTEVATRSADNLEKLAIAEQPKELRPVAESVNGLLSSLERSLVREKRFTDDAAHELRTPITSIKMVEQLLRRDNRDPALTGYLDQLQAGVDQSQVLIEQLLQFARLQSARELQHEPTDFRTVLRAQLDLLAPQITSRALSVEIEDDAYAPPNQANAAAIGLLFANLLSNAVKFSPAEGLIQIHLDSVMLAIEDQGPGIPKTDRERVFDRFFRGSHTLDKPGSGLGLALAHWVANVHRYQLRVVDPLSGSGARLVLTFEGNRPRPPR